jgi:hypothetical protein
MSGYSGTPLAKKLGIKEGFTIKLVNQPDYYFELFTDMPEKITVSAKQGLHKNVVHLFVTTHKELIKQLPILRNEIVQDGMIWVSWPKKASKVESDITEDIIRNLALKMGLVDIKVCAVDDIWSGLKLVIPIKNRHK